MKEKKKREKIEETRTAKCTFATPILTIEEQSKEYLKLLTDADDDDQLKRKEWKKTMEVILLDHL